MKEKNNLNLKLHLAPMCGITDRITRKIAKENGADVTWSEMVSSEGLIRQTGENGKSLALAEKFSEKEKPYWVQIFGNNPDVMARAAEIVEEKIKPSGIDINLGCPVPKAKKAGYGAVQMADIPSVVKIIKAIKRKIALPLSLKTRLGLKEPEEILAFAPRLEKAGLDQLVVHARTLAGMFSAEPDWQVVKKLKEKISIPIVYNGGINSPEKALFYRQKTGLDDLMIGRGAIGRPWLFAEIKHFLKTGEKLSVPLARKKEIIIKQARMMEESKGSLISFRGQFLAYLKELRAPRKLRVEASQIRSLAEAQQTLDKI